MAFQVTQRRSSLPRARAALQKGSLNIGFIGGSITESKDMYRSYSDHTANGIAAAFPEARITFRCAGIGATESTLGAFRVKQDIIDAGCDLLFVEFAVNDIGKESALRLASREGLLRQVLATDTCDVVFVYTYCQDMYDEMMADKMPPTIAEFEELAEHYHISSVWMGLNALNHVKKGVLRWEEWLPDGLHPNVGGSRYYADPVIALTVQELHSDSTDSFVMPQPLSPEPWEHIHTIPLTDLAWKNPWKLRVIDYRTAVETFLDTSAVDAHLEIPFDGTGLFLGFVAGMCAAFFDYRIDGGEWQPHSFNRHEWMDDNNWYHSEVFAQHLPNGHHTFELRTKHSGDPTARGTRTDLALVGVFE